jgi:hypothetical protein
MKFAFVHSSTLRCYSSTCMVKKSMAASRTLVMLAGLLLTAANVIPVTDESMLELTRSLQSSSNKPAFLMYVPEDCQTEACKMMLMFWQMAGTEMPGLVWLVDCNEASTQALSLGNSVHRIVSTAPAPPTCLAVPRRELLLTFS